ncbi:MAG: polysaccharide pyruvyl transferase family protein [Hyphomicrobiales bacterium]|nr:polysaccharide pyruvyl transferase family protein [Hyphomicrobiales bacterium]MCP5372988.1 polysaccharide pyruvyl transferase family protein [Hyphomicrobiales bacterium]
MRADRRLLNLVSQRDIIDSLPNVGDRALQKGFALLLARHGGAAVDDGNWKNFPGLTWAALGQAGGDPAEVYEAWYRRVTGPGRARLGAERLAAAVLGPRGLSRPWLAHPLDRLARRRTGQTFWQAAGPRLLKTHFSDTLVGQIRAADAVVVSAGGLIADHLTRFLPGRLFEIYLAKRLGRPVAVLNYSLALSRPETAEAAAPALRAADVHVLREPQSLQPLLDLGVPADRVRVSVDTVFALEAGAQWNGATGTVGLSIRGDRPVDLDAWAAVADEIRRRHGVRVVMVQGDPQHDGAVRRDLGRRCRLDDDGTFVDHPGIVQVIAGLDLLVTERYHPAVFATQAGTPFVPVAATTHKMDGLVDLIDYPMAVSDPPRGDNLAPILEAVDRALARGPDLSAPLRAFAAEAHRRVNEDYRAAFHDLWTARTS